jgi:alanine dehydrogenase
MIALTRADVASLLNLADCIDAVEQAFIRHARGEVPATPGVLGTHVPGGGFHVKTAALGSATGVYYAAKVNANFPANGARHGLPTIQGLVALFDVETGKPLALLDSIEITILRTAAASAVAARRLARADATTVTVIGCGEQGRSHLRALALVRDVQQAFAIDRDPEQAARFAATLGNELGISIVPNEDAAVALSRSDMWVTTTPSRSPIIPASLLRPGLFIAAVGADSPEKQELEAEILARTRVVVDLVRQCAEIGELHHALAAGVMSVDDIHGELGEILAGKRRGRTSDDETFVFDSTGTALQDVAAAAITYERAVQHGVGTALDLA